jgi:DNA polymerase bacteriophage-type
MTNRLDLDYETAGTVDLKEVGIWNYCTHPDTRILMLNYSFDKGPVEIWRPFERELPEEVRNALADPFITKYAFNCAFERLITKFILGIDVPISEWRDIQVMARHYSLPGSLEDVGEILGLNRDVAKIHDGRRLIKKFSMPFIEGGEKTLFGVSEAAFKDHRTDPEDWIKFEVYGGQDVKAQIGVDERLAAYPVPKQEWRYWELDQEINDLGLFIYMPLLNGAVQVVEKEQEILLKELKELTGIDNPNSPAQLLEWVKTQNYPFSGLGKAFVDRAISGEGGITDLCRKALAIRKQVSKSSVKKLYAFRDNVANDGRLKHQFVFAGAARTMRWSGRDAQLQNLARPVKEVEKNMGWAIELLIAADHATIKKEFSSVLDVAVSCIRALIQAPKGKQLIIADYSSIESRVLGWVAKCPQILQIFEKGLDPYKQFATLLFNKPYDSITKEERNLAKPGFLGCGYLLGPGKEEINEAGDLVRSGLLGYAAAMSIEMTQEQAIHAVQVFRKKYPEVPKLWKALDQAALNAVRTGEEQEAGMLKFDCPDGAVLRMILPSGRAIHYVAPEIEELTFTNRDGETYTKECVSFEGIQQETRQWTRLQSRPGLWTENSVQAIARDLLAHGIKTAHERKLTVIGHIHDEILCEEDESNANALNVLIECMNTLPIWASGLPINSEGYCNKYYKKG